MDPKIIPSEYVFFDVTIQGDGFDLLTGSSANSLVLAAGSVSVVRRPE